MAYYHHQTTAELKLHYTQLKQQLAGEGGRFYFTMDPLMNPDPRDVDSAELRHTEDELLRRWQAGDKGAYLPEFAQ